MKTIEETLTIIRKRYAHQKQMRDFWTKDAEKTEEYHFRGWKAASTQSKELAQEHQSKMNILCEVYADIKEMDWTDAIKEMIEEEW